MLQRVMNGRLDKTHFLADVMASAFEIIRDNPLDFTQPCNRIRQLNFSADSYLLFSEHIKNTRRQDVAA
ncbi:hypothetical protein D3C81_2177260 [compost metagenome]